MMTRSKANQELESRLRETLEELQVSKSLCDQLIQERAESEEEIEKIVYRNAQYKNELAEMSTQFSNVIDQRDQLEAQVTKFHQCSDTHVQALDRIHHLERELSEAQDLLAQYEQEKVLQRDRQSLSLYQELVADSSAQENSSERKIIFSSKKKTKKYAKVKKFITKTQRVLKASVYCSKINTLEVDLASAQRQLAEYASAMREMMILSEHNTRMIDSLFNEITDQDSRPTPQYEQHATQSTLQSELQQCPPVELDVSLQQLRDIPESAERDTTETSQSEQQHLAAVLTDISRQLRSEDPQPDGTPDSVTLRTSDAEQSHPHKNITTPHTIVISDRIGIDIGIMLNNCINQPIINHCMPDLTYTNIIDYLDKMNVNSRTNIVILIGNSLNVRKKDILEKFQKLHDLGAGKIIICAFPFCKNLPDPTNERIHSLNTLLYNLTCRHSDSFLYFDTNKFIGKIYLTKDTLYVPKKFKHNIATLLAYNINAVNSNINVNIQLGGPTSSNFLN